MTISRHNIEERRRFMRLLQSVYGDDHANKVKSEWLDYVALYLRKNLDTGYDGSVEYIARRYPDMYAVVAALHRVTQ